VLVGAFLASAPLLLTGIAYFGLVPLSFVNTLALAAVILQFGYQHEFEALQCLGVRLCTFASPLIGAAACVQLAASAIAVALAGPSADALLVAGLSALGMAIAGYLMIDRAWNAWEKSIAGIAGIAITGIAAQAALVACTLAILWRWGFVAAWIAMAVVAALALVALYKRIRLVR